MEEENIPFGGVQSAEVLLGRDTRPSGEALLEAAKHVRTLKSTSVNTTTFYDGKICVGGMQLICFASKGINAIIGAVAIDMGVLTTPQLHWMVRSRNKGMVASESDYLAQLSKSFRSVLSV